MDQVHRMTYKGNFWNSKVVDPSPELLRKYRTELRGAHKFVLDDPATRLVASLSGNRDKMGYWSILARLPFERLWIEFDNHTMIDELSKVGRLTGGRGLRDDGTFVKPDFDQIGKKVGYLLVREGETRWWAVEFVDASTVRDSVDVYVSPVIFLFDPDATSSNPVTGSTFWQAPSLSHLDDPLLNKTNVTVVSEGKEAGVFVQPESLYWGMIEDKAKVSTDPNIAPEPISAFVNNKVGAVLEPCWNDMWHRAGKDHTKYGELIQLDVRERAGTLRRLITILALINSAPDDRVSVKSRPGSMSVGMNRLKYFDHSMITIKVPKTKSAVNFYERLLTRNAREMRRRAHNVRGYWRTLERGKKIVCRHEPMSEAVDNKSSCHKCGMQIMWIPEHVRGDATLGWVNAEYQVTK